jgi:uncharacterized protein YaiL (DUF2058 family)
MRNLLQQQLVKAGLIDKNKAKAVAHEQMLAQKRQTKGPSAPSVEQVDAQRALAERTERDRVLATQQKAQAHEHEMRAQIRQIVDAHKLPRGGEITYAFSDNHKIRNVLVDSEQRTQLANGRLLIVRHGDGYEMVPRSAAEKIRERDVTMIVLDHAPIAAANSEEDPYKDFPVPDDLIW